METFNIFDVMLWAVEGAVYGAIGALVVGCLFNFAYLRFMATRVREMREECEAKALAEIVKEGEEG